MNDKIAEAVIADIRARSALGLRKYGQYVGESPLSRYEWAKHAYEEALDQAIYLRRLMEELGP